MDRLAATRMRSQGNVARRTVDTEVDPGACVAGRRSGTLYGSRTFDRSFARCGLKRSDTSDGLSTLERNSSGWMQSEGEGRVHPMDRGRTIGTSPEAGLKRGGRVCRRIEYPRP